MLDADIAAQRAQLDKLVQARDTIAAAYGAGTEPVASTVDAPMPARVAGAKGGRRSAARRSEAARPMQQEAQDQVFTFLGKQSRPVSQPDVVTGTKLSLYRVNGAIEALRKRGVVVRTGKTSQMRVGLPAVMARAAKEEL